MVDEVQYPFYCGAASLSIFGCETFNLLFLEVMRVNLFGFMILSISLVLQAV